MKNRAAVLLFLTSILTCFLGACTRETGDYTFDAADSAKIDESQLVLTRFPSGMKAVNDSVLGMVVNGQKIALYNVSTGMNLRNFSSQQMNFDSLIRCTYQEHYKGTRVYTYDALTAGGLSDGNSQVLGFDHDGSSFYIYVNTLVDVNYDQDTAQIKKYESDPQLQAIKKTTGSYNLIVQEYLEFLFVTDEQFRIKNVIPLYEKNALKKEDYAIYYQQEFAVEGNTIYAPVLKNDQVTGNLDAMLKTSPGLYSIAKLNTQNTETAELKLSYEQIDYRGFSLGDFFSAPLVLKYNTNEMLFSNGKEICAVESGDKVFAQSPLMKNEWISDFWRNDDRRLTMVTYTTAKKSHPSDIDLAYSIDSISSMHLKIFDKEKQRWLADKPIRALTNPGFLVTSDKIICIEKGKENYFLKIIRYHEN
jgi:hypothetical protein